jgi:maltose alpha-D-glucosyltransferase/alpha-amylase
MPQWLEDAVGYEIYPQTFYDTNGDGIGDLEGIIQKLDYIKDLGCNTLWINPCFDSPFKDAGYDVRDYKKVAPRYGTNDDLKRLFAQAHKHGIKVLLDLVPGHTSEEHAWFKESAKPLPNECANRYIWTPSWFHWAEGFKVIAGEAERDGAYIVNFFKCQPALNYGFLNPSEPWQLPVDHPDCIATREALKDIMRFWLDAGCDGFRVDMADSLVKKDDQYKSGTAQIWQNIRAMLDKDYPEAALVSEWSNPPLALKAGFHMDFLLDHEGSGYKSLVRDYRYNQRLEIEGADNSFFKKDGSGAISRFLDQYLPWYESTKDDGYISLITGNHDTPRISGNLSQRELALAYAFFFTMPGVPFLYYGDEIGMRYLRLPTKEGGYTRTGSRTPMQWSAGENKGFSQASADKCYLPSDAASDAPTVEEQAQKEDSLLNTVKALLRLRHAEPDLQAKPNLQICYAGKEEPFIYRRGSCVVAVNPREKPVAVPFKEAGTAIFALGQCSLENGECRMEGQSFGVWKI